MTDAKMPGRQEADGTRVVPVDLAGHPYDIRIRAGLLDDLAAEIARAVPDATKILPVVDQSVWELLSRRLCAAWEGTIPVASALIIPSGEASKSFDRFASLLEHLLTRRPDRQSVILAVGGGVVGDLAGFAAASLLRGVRFIQVPTTLLAQVDSSVGGKTGINASHGKNLIGAFHQPSAVLIDPLSLTSLPVREVRAGYAEVVKYAGLDPLVPLDRLEALAPAVFGPQDRAFEAAVTEIVALSVASKARIVALDEREAGVRAWLNLGHTFGHALEAMAGYDGRLLHGEGVALGLRLAYDHGVRLGLCDGGLRDRMVAHLSQVGLPVDPGAVPGLTLGAGAIDRLMGFMAGDKKAESGTLTLVLPQGLGRVQVLKNADPEAVRQTWAAALGRE